MATCKVGFFSTRYDHVQSPVVKNTMILIVTAKLNPTHFFKFSETSSLNKPPLILRQHVLILDRRRRNFFEPKSSKRKLLLQFVPDIFHPCEVV